MLCGAADDEPVAFQSVQHPAHRRRVDFKIIGQGFLGTGAVADQVRQQFGLTGSQADFGQVMPQIAALGVKGPVQQHVKGPFHGILLH